MAGGKLLSKHLNQKDRRGDQLKRYNPAERLNRYHPGKRYGRESRTQVEVLEEFCEEQYHRIFTKLFVPIQDSPTTVRMQKVRESRNVRQADAVGGEIDDTDFEYRK